MPFSLTARDVSVDVPGRRLVDKLDLALTPGMFVAVLGRNGTGKSLTMLTLAGLREPSEGEVRLDGRAVSDWSTLERAKKLALMPQILDDRFPQTVRETVLIGRYPHIARYGWESSEDEAVARHALDSVGLGDFAERDILGLSGGERRRLAIAQVLAQQPNAYLIDEPTNHLDPQHQFETMAIFRQLADAGHTVVASLHDVNMASRFADHCLLLDGEGGWTFGPTDECLTPERLTALYGISMQEIVDGDARWFAARPPEGTSQPGRL